MTWANFKYLIMSLFSKASYTPLLLIYQMKKAGSQTIEASLSRVGLKRQIFRIHFMSQANSDIMRNYIAAKIFPADYRNSMQRQIEESLFLNNVVWIKKLLYRMNLNRKNKLYLIVGLREPVGALLASLFQNYQIYFEDLEQVTLQSVHDIFIGSSIRSSELSSYSKSEVNFIQNWFDTELKSVIGIDVYDQPFPYKNGYVIRENNFAKVLIYRFENIKNLQSILEEFFNIKLEEGLSNRNFSTNKDYGEIYSIVKNKLTLPMNYLDKIYDTKFARYFYTVDEIKKFKEHWGQPQSQEDLNNYKISILKRLRPASDMTHVCRKELFILENIPTSGNIFQNYYSSHKIELGDNCFKAYNLLDHLASPFINIADLGNSINCEIELFYSENTKNLQPPIIVIQNQDMNAIASFPTRQEGHIKKIIRLANSLKQLRLVISASVINTWTALPVKLKINQLMEEDKEYSSAQIQRSILELPITLISSNLTLNYYGPEAQRQQALKTSREEVSFRSSGELDHLATGFYNIPSPGKNEKYFVIEVIYENGTSIHEDIIIDVQEASCNILYRVQYPYNKMNYFSMKKCNGSIRIVFYGKPGKELRLPDKIKLAYATSDEQMPFYTNCISGIDDE